MSGTNQQAALSPAVAVSDYASLVCSFLFSATTGLIAAKVGSKIITDGDNQEQQSPTTTPALLATSLRLSAITGLIAGTIIMASSKTLITSIMGSAAKKASSASVVTSAVRYVRIRSLGFPPALIIGSAQAACLAFRDVRSPFIVLLSASMINLVGDAILVGSKYAMFNGAAGAAWATVVSQYAACIMFLHFLIKKPKSKSNTSTPLGMLSRFKDKPSALLLKVPTMEDARPFLTYVASERAVRTILFLLAYRSYS